MRVSKNGLGYRLQNWFFRYDWHWVYSQGFKRWWRYTPENKFDFRLKMAIAVLGAPFKAVWFAFWCIVATCIGLLLGWGVRHWTLLSLSELDFTERRRPIFFNEDVEFYPWEIILVPLAVALAARRWFPMMPYVFTGTLVVSFVLYVVTVVMGDAALASIMRFRKRCERVEYEQRWR